MHRVNCQSCGRPFDAEKAAECDCIQPVRSFRCPHCAACFCHAPESYKSAFWRDAPKELWDRRKAPTAATADENPSAETITRPLVLFADDDPTGRAIARRVVANLGYGIVLAANGEDALRFAREYQPELVITDALMPRLDGREMARTVKQELPNTRIVIITSVYKDARYKHEAIREFGADEYLSKPLKAADLRAVVQKYVARVSGQWPADSGQESR